jgi:hypothetical protein
MSNSEPSAIVLQGIACMCGLYTVSHSSLATILLLQAFRTVAAAWDWLECSQSAASNGNGAKGAAGH